MLTYQVGAMLSYVKQFTFPAGEVGIKAHQPLRRGVDVTIQASIKSSEDVMALLMLNDALRRQIGSDGTITLDMPYIPYARQDRVCNEGESLSIAVFAQLINSCNFSEVLVLDPHSDVAPALIHNVRIRTQLDVFAKIKASWSNTILVAPDAGAYKKTHAFAKAVGAKGVLACNKARNLSTGEITELSFTDEVDPTAEYLVLDDIGDGMRTFIELGILLQSKGVLPDLAVTHGIFSKGLPCFTHLYRRIWTTTSYHGEDHPLSRNIKWLDV